MKQFKKVLLTAVSIVLIASIVSIIYKQTGMEVNDDSPEAKAYAKKAQKHRDHVRKLHDDRMNEANIDEISKDYKGYRIANKPAQKDNELVKPKDMKVYTVHNGKKKDITDKGDIAFQQNGSFISWTYQFDKNADVEKDIKPELGHRIIYDVTYDEKVKPNTVTKEGQLVKKQKTELERQIIEDEQGDVDKASLKKHKKQLKDAEKWEKTINNDAKQTHRYEHEIRYPND